MDKTPDTSTQRRSQKRPHSPQDESLSSSTEVKALASDTASVLDSDVKRDKLLRLLGGKKRKNETAASKWLERVRAREDDLKVSTDLESQFNESLTQRLSGASRRHQGMGFKEEKPSQDVTTTSDNSSTKDSITDSSNSTIPSSQSDSQNYVQTSSIVASLSNRANIPSLSRPRLGHRPPGLGYQPPAPYYNYGSGNMMSPTNFTLGYGSLPLRPPNMGYGGSYIPPPPPPNIGYTQPPLPSFFPAPPKPPSPPSDKQSNQAPKSKNAFYAQFKKAS